MIALDLQDSSHLGEQTFSLRASAAGGPVLPLSHRSNPGSPNTAPVPSVWPFARVTSATAEALQRKSTVCGLNGSPPRLVNLARRLPFQSSTRLVPRGSCAYKAFLRGALLIAPLSARKICNSIFSRSKAANSKKTKNPPRLTVPRFRNG